MKIINVNCGLRDYESVLGSNGHYLSSTENKAYGDE